MSRGETGKQRQTRIELGYYKQPDAIAHWRRRVVVLTVLLAAVWFGLAPLWDRGSSSRIRLFEWDRLASPGPLVRAHSTWESRCEACHVPFRQVKGTGWSPLASADNRVSDQQCQTCHAGIPTTRLRSPATSPHVPSATATTAAGRRRSCGSRTPPAQPATRT